MDKLNNTLNQNRFIPIDTEEMSALEYLGKIVDKTNEVVERTTIIDNREDGHYSDLNSKKEDKTNITNNRKLSEQGNFTGSWFGISNPSYSEPGIAGVVESHTNKISTKEVNSYLLTNLLQKLKNGGVANITCFGDSTTYGYNSSGSRLPDTTLADDGSAHYANRADVTYPEFLHDCLESVYGEGKITVTNKGYEGDYLSRALTRWNVSNNDIALLMYGINDADNSNCPYKGDVQQFIYYYRQIIERELLNGTACVILSPYKLKVDTGTSSLLRHSNINIFSKACKMIAKEYNIPFIDTKEIMRGYDVNIYSDFTHFSTIGYKTLGARISSLLIGNGCVNPFEIDESVNMGVSIMNDSFFTNNIQGWYYLTNSPTACEDDASGGTYINLKNLNSTITYSFYTKKDNMIFTPHFQYGYDGFTFDFILDFNIETAKILNTEFIPKQYNLPINSSISYTNNDKNYSQRFSPNQMKYISDKHILIPNKGWHTLTFKVSELTTIGGVLNWFGIKCETIDNFVNRTSKKFTFTLQNNFVEYDGTTRPIRALQKGNLLTLEGMLSNVQQGLTKTILTLPSEIRPKGSRSFICSQSIGNNKEYGNVTINTDGTVICYMTSSTSDYLQLYGIIFNLE